MFVPLKETSVESLLQISTHALAKLQLPREQVSEVLQQIHNGSCGAIYRTKVYIGDPAKPKSVVVKALKGKRRSAGLLFPLLTFFTVSPHNECLTGFADIKILTDSCDHSWVQN